MDAKLWAWGLRVKVSRRPGVLGRPNVLGSLPTLWLFTDAERLPDPLAVIARLPRGRCGVVFRHDAAAGREALGRAVARLCRQRRLTLAVSGDWRLAARLGAGLHLRGGRAPAHAARSVPRLTASAHDRVEVRRACASGVKLVFVSPVFSTLSHPGAIGLGARGWAKLAGRLDGRAAALGGIDGRAIRALPQWCQAIGAIDGLK